VALNRRSHVITDGDARAANRSMLYPVGFTAADFGKPIVGVPHGHSTMTPCNAGIQSLVNCAVDESARVLVRAIEADLKPRDIITRKSIADAIAVVMATGGSTNAVLHCLAIAKAAGVKWDIEDFERVARGTPVLCDLKPSGRFVAVDFHRAGGVSQVLKILLANDRIDGDCVTITGRTNPTSDSPTS